MAAHEIIQQLPKWVFTFLAATLGLLVLAFVVVAAYSLIAVDCTVEIMNLGFGKKQACGPEMWAVPDGAMLAWDPIVRRDDGLPTGAVRKAPDGWKLCNGLNGTPDVKERFLMGVASIDAAGKLGGSNVLPQLAAHSHGGETGILAHYAPGEINWDSKEGHRDQFAHVHTIAADGAHDHGGENRPAFYTVVFLCRDDKPAREAHTDGDE